MDNRLVLFISEVGILFPYSRLALTVTLQLTNNSVLEFFFQFFDRSYYFLFVLVHNFLSIPDVDATKHLVTPRLHRKCSSNICKTVTFIHGH